MIVAMDESNKKELASMDVKNLKKTGDFGFEGRDVTDLYYEPHKTDEVWQMVSEGADRILLQCK